MIRATKNLVVTVLAILLLAPLSSLPANKLALTISGGASLGATARPA